MRRTARTIASLTLCALCLLPGCATLRDDFSQPPAGDDQAVLEQMRVLQEQLKLVQEKLARLQAEEALAQGRKSEAPAAWAALAEAGKEPAGYGRYSYLLFRDAQRFDAIVASLDALPARSDLPQAEANRFLLPLAPDADGGRPSWDKYSVSLTAELLKLLGDAAAPMEGPLLVVADRPLGENPEVLIIDLSGAPDDFAAELLTHCQSRVAAEESGPAQAPFFWDLLGQTAPRPATVARSGAAILLSWRP